MNNAQTLEKGLTHPQIHIDYYKWLNTVKSDSFLMGFVDKHSKNLDDFHAIAMWVWGASREELVAKMKEY